jgi:hypothetical protein
MISGGLLMIRRWPSTTAVSFPIACRLSRVWAFASAFSVALSLALCLFNFRVLRVAL